MWGALGCGGVLWRGGGLWLVCLACVLIVDVVFFELVAVLEFVMEAPGAL